MSTTPQQKVLRQEWDPNNSCSLII